MKSHSKFHIAESQLKSAIELFVSDNDRFSVVTLAGAANTIFNQLLLNQDKENFTDLSRKEEAKKTGVLKNRSEYGREINDILGINSLKHMDTDDDNYVKINLDECALAAVSMAVANYVSLAGKKKILSKRSYIG